MTRINYLSEQDKMDAAKKWENVIDKLSKRQLQMTIIFLINGLDLDRCFEFILDSHK